VGGNAAGEPAPAATASRSAREPRDSAPRLCYCSERPIGRSEMLRMAKPARAPRIPAVRPDGRRPALPLALGAVERWRPARLPIDPGTVLRLSRYRRRDEVAPAIWETAQCMATRAEALVEPAAMLAAARIAGCEPGAVRLAPGSTFSGRAVATLLAGCPLAVAFALTLGPRLEAAGAALAERKGLLGAVLL